MTSPEFLPTNPEFASNASVLKWCQAEVDKYIDAVHDDTLSQTDMGMNGVIEEILHDRFDQAMAGRAFPAADEAMALLKKVPGADLHKRGRAYFTSFRFGRMALEMRDDLLTEKGATLPNSLTPHAAQQLLEGVVTASDACMLPSDGWIREFASSKTEAYKLNRRWPYLKTGYLNQDLYHARLLNLVEDDAFKPEFIMHQMPATLEAARSPHIKRLLFEGFLQHEPHMTTTVETFNTFIETGTAVVHDEWLIPTEEAAVRFNNAVANRSAQLKKEGIDPYDVDLACLPWSVAFAYYSDPSPERVIAAIDGGIGALSHYKMSAAHNSRAPLRNSDAAFYTRDVQLSKYAELYIGQGNTSAAATCIAALGQVSTKRALFRRCLRTVTDESELALVRPSDFTLNMDLGLAEEFVFAQAWLRRDIPELERIARNTAESFAVDEHLDLKAKLLEDTVSSLRFLKSDKLVSLTQELIPIVRRTKLSSDSLEAQLSNILLAAEVPGEAQAAYDAIEAQARGSAAHRLELVWRLGKRLQRAIGNENKKPLS